MSIQQSFKKQVEKFIRSVEASSVSIITSMDMVDTKWGCCLIFVGNGDDVCLEIMEDVNNILEDVIGERDKGIDELVDKVIASDPSVCGRA
jgi:hypothetical protein